MTFECVVKKGHIGAGKYVEDKIFVNASNILQAMEIAKSRGAVKKGRSNNSGQSIVEIKAVDSIN